MAWIGLSHNLKVRESIVETQLQIAKSVEAALLTDGYSRDSVLAKRHQIRGFLFYPEGKGRPFLNPPTPAIYNKLMSMGHGKAFPIGGL